MWIFILYGDGKSKLVQSGALHLIYMCEMTSVFLSESNPRLAYLIIYVKICAPKKYSAKGLRSYDKVASFIRHSIYPLTPYRAPRNEKQLGASFLDFQ
jgi:hypothetical protein